MAASGSGSRPDYTVERARDDWCLSGRTDIRHEVLS